MVVPVGITYLFSVCCVYYLCLESLEVVDITISSKQVLRVLIMTTLPATVLLCPPHLASYCFAIPSAQLAVHVLNIAFAWSNEGGFIQGAY